jgi:hypothetical protein
MAVMAKKLLIWILADKEKLATNYTKAINVLSIFSLIASVLICIYMSLLIKD